MDGIDLDFNDFLAPFDGLEGLFIMLESDYANVCYTKMILWHRNDLRGLIFHRHHYCLDEKSPYWEEYCDSPLGEGGFLANLLRATKLECAGFYGEISQLQKWPSKRCVPRPFPQVTTFTLYGKARPKAQVFQRRCGWRWLTTSQNHTDLGRSSPEWATPPRRSPGPDEGERRVRRQHILGKHSRNLWIRKRLRN